MASVKHAPASAKVPMGEQDQAQVVVCAFVHGTQYDRLAEACHGVRRTTMGLMRLAQGVDENGIVGREQGGLVEPSEGFVRMAGIQGNHPEQIDRLGVPRVLGEQLPAGLLRRDGVARLIEAIGPVTELQSELGISLRDRWHQYLASDAIDPNRAEPPIRAGPHLILGHRRNSDRRTAREWDASAARGV